MLDTATPVSDAPERSAAGRRPSTAVAATVALALIGASAGIASRGGREVALVAAGAPASTRTATLDGRWVAQVASKAVGTVDPQQTAADGTHVFLASDILAEHQQLAVANADADHVLLLVAPTSASAPRAPTASPAGSPSSTGAPPAARTSMRGARPPSST